jgi:hypothetical protein
MYCAKRRIIFWGAWLLFIVFRVAPATSSVRTNAPYLRPFVRVSHTSCFFKLCNNPVDTRRICRKHKTNRKLSMILSIHSNTITTIRVQCSDNNYIRIRWLRCHLVTLFSVANGKETNFQNVYTYIQRFLQLRS